MKSHRPDRGPAGLGAIACAVMLAGCHHARAPGWESAPLLPRIEFDQVVPPRSVALLLVDAHSGAPVADAAVLLDRGTPAVQSDSNGRVIFLALTPGRHAIRTMAYRYMPWHGSIDVPDSAGVVRVVQLHRAHVQLTPICTTDFRFGLLVTVVDSVTGQPTASAVLIARTSGAVDSVGPRGPLPTTQNGPPALVLNAAGERAGTYDLTVRSPAIEPGISPGSK